jgi:GT2 family glycosyltransferase
MGTSLVTVIMPLKYYHPEFLKKSVHSIIRQSSHDWKLAVVVEPEDLTKFRLLFEQDYPDPRVEVIANRGFRFPGAINTGMKHAKTRFVAILLADDMWSNDAIETLNRYIIQYPEVDFFHSSRILIDENDAPISRIRYSKDEFSLRDFPLGSPVKHLLCWRREKGLAVGGIDETILKAQDDYDFPWTMAEHGATFKAVKECLYYYRNHCECERLTTHRPLNLTRRGTRGILRKHGVGLLKRTLIIRRMLINGTLGQQCLYRNSIDQWIKGKLGYDARRGWKQTVYK